MQFLLEHSSSASKILTVFTEVWGLLFIPQTGNGCLILKKIFMESGE
jgi:hypothetical protein